MAGEWKLEGYDTFEGGDAYYSISKHDSENEVVLAAVEQLKQLQKTQPSDLPNDHSMSIQDQIHITSPDGQRRRFFSKDSWRPLTQ